MDQLLLQEYILLFVSGLNFLVGVYVLKHKPSHAVYWSFFLFVLGTGTWTLGLALLSITTNFIFDKVVLYGGVITVGGFCLFSNAFPDQSRILKKQWLSYLPLFILALFIPTNTFIAESIVHADGTLQPVNGPGFPVFAGIMSAYIIYGIYIFFKKYRISKGRHKQQMHYLMAGASIFLLSAMIFDVVLPAFDIFELNLLGPASSVFFVGGTAYAIVRHHLMDIRLIIKRSAIYTCLLLLLSAFYFGVASLTGWVMHQKTNITPFVSGWLSALIAVVGLPHVKKFFEKTTDKIFFKKHYDPAQSLQEISRILNYDFELKTIKTNLVNSLQATLKSRDVKITLENEFNQKNNNKNPMIKTLDASRFNQARLLLEVEEKLNSKNLSFKQKQSLQSLNSLMKKYQAEVATPIILGKRIIGIIFLTEKMSGDYYTAEDLKFLTSISYQAGIAIEKARLYEEVKKHSVQLEQRVGERTKQLKDLQERQKQVMLDIAHSLLTPLTVLKNEWQHVQAKFSDKEKTSGFGKAIDAVSRFVYNLLQLSRLESTKENFKPKKLNFSKLIEGVLEYVEVICKEQKITIKKEIKPDLYLQGQTDRLHSLAANLLSNAVKYIGEGPKKIITVILKKEGKHIIFTVADTGTGIKSKALPNIFSRFWRTNEDGTIKGAGLGLAICKKIAELHGGKINVESVVNKGSKFTVILPLAK